jgi:hypothetical protein
MAAGATSSSLFLISAFLAPVVARSNLHNLVCRSSGLSGWEAEEAKQHGLNSASPHILNDSPSSEN